MTNPSDVPKTTLVTTFEEFAKLADYSLMDQLNADPDATKDGDDHRARQVFSGHYVPVTPTPLPHPQYISHSKTLFKELGLSDELAVNEKFIRLFSGDHCVAIPPMRAYGWATGYALSIYGVEYTHQCPFGTGNGYGDGRAISIFEMLNPNPSQGNHVEMQLKGAGATPYCRGADGRAVLRSSIREFLAQEYMFALGAATSRSLTLYVSKTQTVTRPWYSEHSFNTDPDIMVDNPVAISTRVAPSFLRVGQLELFARRTRNDAHKEAYQELRMIVAHLIEREYKNEIDQTLKFNEQLIELSQLFRKRLTTLVSNWIRVGFCQGNFNGDNCAAGGFTLDYGPFGFCEIFAMQFQPWTGGGNHFSFFNQPAAAQANFHMFCKSVRELVLQDAAALEKLDHIDKSFADEMTDKLQNMWADKLGLRQYNHELLTEVLQLMTDSQADYSMFFRELCALPEDVMALKKSFYSETSPALDDKWNNWLTSWHTILNDGRTHSEISAFMKTINPKYTWREWLVVPAYQQAMHGDYALVKELQEVFSDPYKEQSKEIEDKYYRLKPKQFFNAGGVSHYSCSS